MTTNVYEQAARKYRPDRIEILFIAESPPCRKKGEELRYFYFEEYDAKDFLFRSIMEVILPDDYQVFLEDKNKKRLLRKFGEHGFFLIDACDYPINQYKDRDSLVKSNFSGLIRRMKKEGFLRNTKVILIKKNIYELLCDGLRTKRFRVVNQEFLDFPSSGNQGKFKKKLRRLLDAI